MSFGDTIKQIQKSDNKKKILKMILKCLHSSNSTISIKTQIWHNFKNKV